ncbi:MAG TPA: GFA family protein [Rhizomicrobium sp.]|nr:GFA family protein [Rhizomicrobium sp.]
MTKYKGGCHCGKIAYSFEGEIGTVLECNCSLCQKRGGLLHFVPQSAFTLETPRGDLGTYRFNKKVLAHHFCPDCGIAPFSEGTNPKGETMVAVNVRCVEGIDTRALDIKFHEGRGP